MSARPTEQREAVFQPFSWAPAHLQHDYDSRLAGRMRDLGYGIMTCLKLVEVSELDRQHCRDQDPPQDGAEPDVPLLRPYETSMLFRFAITAAEMIGEQAEQFQNEIKRRHSATSEAGNLRDAQGGSHE